MKTTTLRFIALATLVLLALFVPAAPAAVNTLSSTTLSAAVTGVGGTTQAQNYVVLASITGVNGPSQPTSTSSIGTPSGYAWTVLFVDKEAMRVTLNPTVATAPVYVQRGWDGTPVEGHVSGALVYVSNPTFFTAVDQFGACTAATQYVLPFINQNNANIFDCRSSGQWIKIAQGTMNPTAQDRFAAYCTSSLGSAETEYLNNAACSGATTVTVKYVVPSAGTLANLYVNAVSAVTGGTSKDVLTVYKNGSATALTCTIAASGTTCHDLTDSVSVAAGDLLTFQFVTATSDGGAGISVSVEKF